jgi:rod shape-determining protein MreC
MIWSFIAERKRYIFLIGYLLISFSLMIFSSSAAMQSIKSFFFNTTSYANGMARDLRSFGSNLWYSIRKMNELKKELQTSNEKISLLQDASREIENLRKENERLKELLAYKNQISFKTIPAEIIARDPKYYYNTIIVNKGSADGVLQNMPVIAYQNGQSGIVGKTIEIGMNSCKILLLTDRNSFISAILPGTGYTGLIRGNGTTEHFLNFMYVDRNAMISFGDNVISSGQGGIFPKGVAIGQVVSVNDAKYGFYYSDIKILPVIDFSRLDSVFIILKPESQEVKRFMGQE